ncbi:MAG: ADP-forming succinate--CoA ligase subunit beta [Candidatus Azosocius agrarius]|nr:MAG: ADP-forming succinate--CoA ligase subunit beta [Gammaproteobacteria bacterium]
MYLHEYQAKELLKNYDILIPNFFVVHSKEDIINLLKVIKENKYVVKVQIHSGGRKKAGGIKVVYTLKELENSLYEYFNINFITNQTNKKGKIIKSILIEEYFDVIKEMYFSIVIDRKKSVVSIIASEYGGCDVENILLQFPNRNFNCDIYNSNYLPIYKFREMAINLNLFGDLMINFSFLVEKLVKLFYSKDLNLLEINPLCVTDNNKIVCLDAKFDIDNNAIYRQKDLFYIYDKSQDDFKENLANEYKLNFVSLEGNIGCMVNGAGLAMATIDLIKMYGGEPANFLDIGGAVKEEGILQGFKIIMLDNVSSILVNIFGGIVKCDIIANNLIKVINLLNIKIPIVVRLIGNRSDIAINILLCSGLNIYITNSFSEAVLKVVYYSKMSKLN